MNVTEAGPLPDFSGIRVGIETTEQLDKAQGIDRARQVIKSEFPPGTHRRSRRSTIDSRSIASAGANALFVVSWPS